MGGHDIEGSERCHRERFVWPPFFCRVPDDLLEPRRGRRRLSCPRVTRGPRRLCYAYWFPLYSFIRRKGNGPDQSLDLTQGYFTGLLERQAVAMADPARGRFRTFLLTDCTHFLAHQHEYQAARIRGGGRELLSIDARDAEGRFLQEPFHAQTPERSFERDWALTLLDQVLAGLRGEYERSGRVVLFETLKVTLTDGPRSVPQADLAARLSMSEAAVQVAVHRLRKRYRTHLLAAISATVVDESDVEAELHALFAALKA